MLAFSFFLDTASSCFCRYGQINILSQCKSEKWFVRSIQMFLLRTFEKGFFWYSCWSRFWHFLKLYFRAYSAHWTLEKNLQKHIPIWFVLSYFYIGFLSLQYRYVHNNLHVSRRLQWSQWKFKSTCSCKLKTYINKWAGV